MSPVGGQGVNIALRDALVAANHLCPVLTAGGDLAALDAAARRVRDERWPEIVAVQRMQQKQANLLFRNDSWKARLMQRLLPWLMRTGILQWLQRKEYRLMSEGVAAGSADGVIAALWRVNGRLHRSTSGHSCPGLIAPTSLPTVLRAADEGRGQEQDETHGSHNAAADTKGLQRLVERAQRLVTRFLSVKQIKLDDGNGYGCPKKQQTRNQDQRGGSGMLPHKDQRDDQPGQINQEGRSEIRKLPCEIGNCVHVEFPVVIGSAPELELTRPVE